jgi:hypothetical protein
MSKNYDLEVLKYELMAATRSHRNCCDVPAAAASTANVCVSREELISANRDLEVLKYELLASAISHSRGKRQ